MARKRQKKPIAALSSRRWVWVAMAAVLFVGGVVAAGIATTSQASFCASCHREQAVSLARTSHTTLGCYQCHLADGVWSLPQAKAVELFEMYPARLFGRQAALPAPRISRSACTRCHRGDLAGISDSRGLRVKHESCAGSPAKCDSCHTASAHPGAVRWPRTPMMDDCMGCHNEQGVSTKCDRCHTGKLETERLKTGPWQVTHGPNWESVHGMGDLSTCKTCHPKKKCIGCHKTEIPHPSDFIRTHGKMSLDKKQRCTKCHTSKTFCIGCHGVPMPHPKGFLARHSKVAKNRSDPGCVNCHRQQDCSTCHIMHTHPGSTDGSLTAIMPTVGGRR